ncbi:Beta-lactamase domain-containing protein [Planctomycetales bacterium 10988]|nr:Beta-lactamase domain-containing protein [Planctomycetales bacterium 10988]
MPKTTFYNDSRLRDCTVTIAVLSLQLCFFQHNLQAGTPVDPLAEVLERAAEDGTIIAAQYSLGTNLEESFASAWGHLAPDQELPADEKTLFCIGSCSKPLASICILSLVKEQKLDLDRPITEWDARFAKLATRRGQEVSKAPTIRELLAHRSGIYSQKGGRLTDPQRRAIRDFRLSLEESVDLIAQQPLIAIPGKMYAYSGAGYCVLGRIAEKATSQSFEELLHRQLTDPLGMERTTYFPQETEQNIATPGMRTPQGIAPNETAPHRLGKALRLPLIGGSIYSTASELGLVARMILNKGKANGKTVLPPESLQDLKKPQYDEQNYGLGWVLVRRDGQTYIMHHNGALNGYRAFFQINFAKNQYVAVLWTLADESSDASRRLATEIQRGAFNTFQSKAE